MWDWFRPLRSQLRLIAITSSWFVVFTAPLRIVAQNTPVAQLSDTARPPSNAPIQAEINAAVQTFVDDGTIAGAVTLVAGEGKLVHLGAVGQADLATGREMRNGTMFSIASMTKPIVATGIMILKDNGQLHLDDPVSKYLPTFANTKLKSGEQLTREITIRDLLTHTSGLGGRQDFDGTLAAAADELATRPLDFQPGTKWQYSPGLNVAGRVIEVVSKQPLTDFLRERIFAPLKMNHTTFRPDENQQRRIATLYQPGTDPQSLIPDINSIASVSTTQSPNPSGGLYSTARDLYHFYQMMLDGGIWRDQRILSADSVAEMTSPQTGDFQTGFTPGNCWGLGWCLVKQPQGISEVLSAETFGHGGAFGTQGWVDPKSRTIFVLLIQRTKLPNSDASEVRDAFQRAAVTVMRGT